MSIFLARMYVNLIWVNVTDGGFSKRYHFHHFLVVNILFNASIKFSCLFFRFLCAGSQKNGKNAMCIVYADSGSVIFTFVPLILTKMVIEVMVWWCWSLCSIYFVDACSLLLIYPKTFCWIILCAARKLMLSYFYIPSLLKNVFTFFIF